MNLVVFIFALAIFSEGIVHAGVAPSSSAKVNVASELPDTELVESVLGIIAKYFSVPVNDISLDTHFVNDMNADFMDAFEVLAIICEEEGVVLPKKSDLLTARKIIAYLETAKRIEVSFKLRGQGDASNVKKSPIYVQKVYFATNRLKTGDTDPNNYFGGQRSELNKGMAYGVCEVTIPVGMHKFGQLERPAFFFMKENAKQHIVLDGLEVLGWDRFLQNINEHVGDKNDKSSWSNDAFVFIHGYNVTFDKAVRRTAQIAYDFGFNGAPILFSWPSDGEKLKYFSDRTDIEWSAYYIEKFLVKLRKETGNKRLHIIAHSMGNQGLLRALHRIALKQKVKSSPLFDNVIMAAPDIDTRLFTEQIAPHIHSLSKRWTLYTSDKDSALDLSALFNAAKRLGKPVSVINGIDTIDVTDVDVSPWSVPEFHSYYASKSRVVADIISVLKDKMPVSRQLIKKNFKGINYWQLK
ncbi:MAG: alpha/beta hydrolase [Gammaproteobacteria bacterium]|nr:alpha/beta hydrolase [Gammaproteobacteria bacterium]